MRWYMRLAGIVRQAVFPTGPSRAARLDGSSLTRCGTTEILCTFRLVSVPRPLKSPRHEPSFSRREWKGPQYTLKEIGKLLRLSGARIWCIEYGALRMLKDILIRLSKRDSGNREY